MNHDYTEDGDSREQARSRHPSAGLSAFETELRLLEAVLHPSDRKRLLDNHIARGISDLEVMLGRDS